MVSKISENLRMEKQIDVLSKVIKDLEGKLEDAEREDLTMEVDELLLEIANLQKENEDKMKLLHNIEQEKQILKDNLKIEQDEKHALLENQEKVSDNHSFEEELSLESQLPSIFCFFTWGKTAPRVAIPFNFYPRLSLNPLFSLDQSDRCTRLGQGWRVLLWLNPCIVLFKKIKLSCLI